MSRGFIKELEKRVLIYDGAMGTSLQSCNLSSKEYAGYEGCHEYLVISQAAVIANIHHSFLEAGADVIETNSFGASELTLAEYGLASRAFEISKAAAVIARQAANDYSTPSKPRFVAGSIGPTSKLPCLGQTDFDQLFDSYLPAMLGLLEGGVDLIQIETCQDLLQAKCAVLAARSAMEQAKLWLPICVTVTLESTGTILTGSDIATALTVLEGLAIDMVGLNCATGPAEMSAAIRYLSRHSSIPLAILPNAGFPIIQGGVASYDLAPQEFVHQIKPFVLEFGVACIGGCCGTTPAHIKALAQAFSQVSSTPRTIDLSPRLASTFSAISLSNSRKPLVISERCNANGSKAFRDLLIKEDWDAILSIARQEAQKGADAIDLCAAYVGRSELSDFNQIVPRLNLHLKAALMIDSTSPEVILAALKKISGRAIINSVNLEDGLEKFDQICRLAKQFGTFLVALTIDQEGMAKTAAKKVEIAQRIHKKATERHGISDQQLFFDPLTFTLGSGDRASRNSAVETLTAIKEIKTCLPQVNTVLGISNVSFGLAPAVRKVINSVFFYEAVKFGLDAAIIDPNKLLRLEEITQEQLHASLDLIYSRSTDRYDPLSALLDLFKHNNVPKSSQKLKDQLSTRDLIRQAVIEGQKSQLPDLLDQALRQHQPLQIINDILLPAMQEVGRLFAAGTMQLPFVLLSAEVMKSAVTILQPNIEQIKQRINGKLLLATVKGDVHDIGKNLVEIIVSNNGYQVIDLGIKQPIEEILAAIERYQPDVVGFSGLLVKSTQVMKENLAIMSENQITVPVICGGAALTSDYVYSELQAAYETGQVFYAADAFAGLKILDNLCQKQSPSQLVPAETQSVTAQPTITATTTHPLQCQNLATNTDELPIPTPPFWGVRIPNTQELPPAQIMGYLNKKALFFRQWRFGGGIRSIEQQAQFVSDKVEPIFNYWSAEILKNNWFQPRVIYGYFPCQSEQDTLHLYNPLNKQERLYSIDFSIPTNQASSSLANFFLDSASAKFDLICLQLVTAGKLASQECDKLYKADRYTDYFYLHGFMVALAEALAEFWHHQIRKELGIAGKNEADPETLFLRQYRGARYSFGYPACPQLEHQRLFFTLLQPEAIEVNLTAEYQLIPEQSTSAMIIHRPTKL